MQPVLNRRMRVDWCAAVLAGLAAGAIAWLLSHGLPWFTSGVISPTMMGRNLKPPGAVDPSRSVLTVLAQFVVAIGYGLVIAALVSRVRGLWALALGGAAGLGLYGVNFCVYHFLTGGGWSANEVSVVVTHFVFGLIAAGAYKGLAARRSVLDKVSEHG